MGYTVEFIRKSTIEGLKAVPINLLLTVEINPRLGTGIFDVTITIKEPWTYGTLSNEFSIDHIPNGNDYGRMISHMLMKAHPHLTLTWEYHPIDRRVIIKNDPERDYPWQELLKEYKPVVTCDRTFEENNTMRFTKVVVNGPATIAWVTTGRNPAKKVVIKKADGDIYDLEKAMLMCWAKSWFSDDTDFHKWFRINMKLFREAYDEAHPDIGELPVVDAAAISKNINESLDRMSKALHKYKDRLNSVYGKAAVGDNIVNKSINKWSEDEIKLLKRHYSTKSVKHIAMVLGRSEAAVRAKARKLGIKRGGNTNDI